MYASRCRTPALFPSQTKSSDSTPSNASCLSTQYTSIGMNAAARSTVSVTLWAKPAYVHHIVIHSPVHSQHQPRCRILSPSSLFEKHFREQVEFLLGSSRSSRSSLPAIFSESQNTVRSRLGTTRNTLRCLRADIFGLGSPLRFWIPLAHYPGNRRQGPWRGSLVLKGV